jgi:hypothetical protein
MEELFINGAKVSRNREGSFILHGKDGKETL